MRSLFCTAALEAPWPVSSRQVGQRYPKTTAKQLYVRSIIGWVTWPVKIVPEMTYKVSSGTVSLYTLAHSRCYLPPLCTRLSAKSINHAFVFHSEADLYFTDLGGMEG